MNILKSVIFVIALWNIITFFVYGADKRKAVKGKRRFSEKTLLLCAFMMGGIGALFGMSVFRHKTKHIKFRILVPMAILLNVAVVIGFYYIYKGGFTLVK